MPALSGPAMSGTIHIDCDAGQDMDAALRRLTAAGGGTVHFVGTCRGNFVVRSTRIDIQGESPSRSILLSNETSFGAAVLRVAEGARVSVRDVSLTGTSPVGAHVGGADSTLLVENTETSGVDIGLRAVESSSLTVIESSLQGHSIGIQVSGKTQLLVAQSEISDCTIGLSAFDNSDVTSSREE